MLDLGGGRLPRVLHWGAELPTLTDEDAVALAEAVGAGRRAELDRRPVAGRPAAGALDRLDGRPGLSGSRAGAGWSPRFTVAALALDGDRVALGPGSTNAGAGTLEVDAVDAGGRAGPRADRAADPGGPRPAAGPADATPRPTRTGCRTSCWRCRCPPVAREVLDLAGRWGKERTPQRGRARRRHPPARGAPRPDRSGRGDAAARRRRPASTSPTARSGPCTPAGAATTPTTPSGCPAASRSSAAASCCCRARSCSAPASRTRRPGSTPSYGTGLDEVARRFHRFLRARPNHPGPDRPVTINVWEAVYFDHADHEKLARAGPAGGRGRGRALRPRRRLVRRPARRQRRARRLDRLPRRLARGAAPAGRRGHRARDAVRAVVRAGDGQRGLRRRPGAPGVDHGDGRPAAGRGPPPAGDQPRHPRVLRLRPRPDLRDPGRVRHLLHQVGPQPRPRRRGHPAGRAARRARADARLLPPGRRDQGRPPRAGDRVVLLRRLAGRPRRARAHRPGLGLGLHRPAGAPADAPLDHPADPAGADGLAHRLGRTRTPPAATTSCASARRPRSGATSASSGT